MPRERLPDRRLCETFNFTWNGIGFAASIGRFADHRLGEIFLASHKAGSQLDATARDAAILCSLCLQYGASLETIRSALLHDEKGGPCSPLASALDLIAKQTASGS